MDKYLISNEAWQFYQDHSPPRMMHKFIADLARQQFIDTRPDEYKQSDAIRIAQGLLPYWNEAYQKYPRTLKLDIETLARLYAISKTFKVFKYHENSLKDWQYDDKKPKAIVSYLLEAIGLGYLTPVQMPVSPVYKASTQYQKLHRRHFLGSKELLW